VEPTLRINAPAVVGEIIDGEAVIMDLASGHYFSTQGSGAEIWSGVEVGLGRAGIAAMLAGRYAGEWVEFGRAVDVFVAELLERRLIVEDARPAGAAPAPPPAPSGPPHPVFVAPVLTAYSDMEDLLLLDPIHDVDETGWPMPKAPDATAL
jgi:hypothetical protein